MNKRSVTVSGTDLFRVAAENLGDASQWWRVARLNGMSSPDVPGVRTLLIPDPARGLGDGIPAPDQR